MIVPICYDQPSLAIKIEEPGCFGGQLSQIDNIQLVIVPPHCPPKLHTSKLCFTGCWPGYDVDKWNEKHCPPHEYPMLVYPAFDISDSGAIVFRFDSLLSQRPPGRYIGIIEFTGGPKVEKILEFDIDFCTRRFVASEAAVTLTPCNLGEPDGCY